MPEFGAQGSVLSAEEFEVTGGVRAECFDGLDVTMRLGAWLGFAKAFLMFGIDDGLIFLPRARMAGDAFGARPKAHGLIIGAQREDSSRKPPGHGVLIGVKLDAELM